MLALTIGVFGKIKWDGEKYIGTDPTTTDILGPFYRPGAPFKTDLVQAGTKGEIMHFSGTVFGKDGKALKGALVEIWHCDENGVYDNTSDNYIYRSSSKTGADGKYNFKSIYPVPYAASAIAGDISAKDPGALNRVLDMTKNAKNEKVVKFDVYLKEEYMLEPTAFKKIEGLYEMSDKSMIEFYKDGDQLFAKINGQIMEAMDYKGDNSFAGGIDYVKAKFELLSGGGAKVKVTIKEDKPIEITGTKLLKY